MIFIKWVVDTDVRVFIDCIKGIDIDIFKNIFSMVLGWKLADIPLAGHLWYIETYVECVLWFPLLKCIFRKDNKDNFKVRYYLIGLGVLYALIMDIQSIIRPETFFIQPYSVITPALCLWLIGSEIYNKKELIRGNRNVRYVALAIFILGNLIRSLAQRHIYMVEPTDLQLLMWNSCFGFVIASALAIFFLSIDLKNKTIRNVIGEEYIWDIFDTWNCYNVVFGFHDSEVAACMVPKRRGFLECFALYSSIRIIYFCDFIMYYDSA